MDPERFYLDGTARAQANGTSEAFYAGASVHHVRLDNMTVRREPGGWPGQAISGECNACEVINSRISGWEYGFYIRGTNWLIHNNEIYRERRVRGAYLRLGIVPGVGQ